MTVHTDDNSKLATTTEESLPEDQHNQQDDLKGILIHYECCFSIQGWIFYLNEKCYANTIRFNHYYKLTAL